MAASSSYWQASRAPRYSLLFALPLLVAYEVLAAALEVGADVAVRNGADVLLKSAFIAVAGNRGPIVFGAALVGLAIWFVGRDVKARGAPRHLAWFGYMAAESLALALATGVIVGVATNQLLGGIGALSASVSHASPSLAAGAVTPDGPVTGLMLSLGAGLYEELLFRVLLVGALSAMAQRFAGLRPVPAGAIAATIGALVFSAFHYVGQYGDAWQLQSFVFRALAGLFFSVLYLVRGFGITAWTHALYDVFILVF
jgi:hypothetical protein